MSERTELDLLKERADAMGIKYHTSIGVDKLKEKIQNKLGDNRPSYETTAQKNQRLRKEALELVRVRLTCMNPTKREWPGEIISVSNSCIGTVKKFIPFNADAYHIPKVILGVLKERMYQSFVTKKVNGRKVKRGRLVKEFAIEELPPLTVDELKELAAKQAKDELED